MLRRVMVFGLFGALLSVGCSKEKTDATTVPYLSVSPSALSVVANGSSSVTLTVTDTGSGPITVTTTRGTFSTGGQTATISGVSGTLYLVSCDASASGTCAGTATVAATSPSGSTSTNISFVTLATACSTNCSADAACSSLACTASGGAAGTCSSTFPRTCLATVACTKNPAGATTETSCTDGLDNDCANGADGADASCEDRACDPASPTSVWKSGACTDLASGLALKLTPSRTRLPADDTTTASIEVEVTTDAAPSPDFVVSVSTSGPGTVSAASVTTGADGKATFTFKSGAVGVATITATLASLPTMSQSVQITMPRLGSFQLPENPWAVQHPVMGAATSGWYELGWIQVQVLDDTGLPYPDGLAVRFEPRTLGGSTLGVPLTPDVGSCVAPSCVGHSAAISSAGESADTGLARAFLYSGNVAGTLAVTATATAAGVTRTVTLPTVAVVGGKASGANLSVVCSPRNVPALAETDCSISLVDAPFDCQAMLKDRFNNVLGRETQVIFRSEAAAVGQVVSTPAYDGSAGPQTDLGLAIQGFNTLGAGLPFDVDPDTTVSEPYSDHGLDGCGDRRHNPRDGVVTIVAIADGEEAFWDVNGNGSWDAAPAVTTTEPFVDLGEPFVDQDDDGQYDVGEWFLDVDGSRDWTPPNGRWDAQAKIWTQTVVVYTSGAATNLPAPGGGLLGTRWAELDDFVDPCVSTVAAPSFDVQHASTTATEPTDSYVVVASDMNLNFLNTGAKYGVSIVPSDAPIEVVYRGLESYTDLLGFHYRYWPCDQSGNCASQCRATGTDAPCTMTPAIVGYSCGAAAQVDITGGNDPGYGNAVWNVEVPWTTYDEVGRIQHGGDWLGGIVQ